MREIPSDKITELVEKLCIDANINLRGDIARSFEGAYNREKTDTAKSIIGQLIENAKIAREEKIPVCQDTGMAVIFAEIGQDVHITGGDLAAAINEGVRRGYRNGYLRKSVVADPIERINTADNTPAVIYFSIVPGNEVKITAAPKGFGSENKSAVKMLIPSDGIEGVKKFVTDTVRLAGSDACPPLIVGVGVGGTMDYAALLAKQALKREIESRNENPFWAETELELLRDINSLNIGPAGFGGETTALKVNIETYPTHIAALPVAVNIGCHATRHSQGVL
ncbi:MAG: fumarate hydratase [Clostridiales bacterium]|jgi:fumarate hydratase subunit alpha|nr:fumarate hydratase [Clostridiales bacterium]